MTHIKTLSEMSYYVDQLSQRYIANQCSRQEADIAKVIHDAMQSGAMLSEFTVCFNFVRVSSHFNADAQFQPVRMLAVLA